MGSPRILNDSFALNDSIAFGGKLWADTEIIAGYGYHHADDRLHYPT